MMKRLVCAFLAATLCGSAVSAEAACRMKLSVTYPVTMIDHEPFIDATVDGKPARFRFTLNSSQSFLWRSGAKALGVKPELDGQTIVGPGGAVDLGWHRFNTVKAGDTTQLDVDMMVIQDDQSHLEAGMLAQDFLGEFDVELDLGHRAIRLIRPQDCIGDQVVYWRNTYTAAPLASLLEVQVSVNGRPATALLDPAQRLSVVTVNGAKRLGLSLGERGQLPASMLSGLIFKPIDVWTTTIQSLSIGDDETVKGIVLAVGDVYGNSIDRQPGPGVQWQFGRNVDLILGDDFLEAHRVYLSQNQQRVYMTYLGGPIFQTLDKELIRGSPTPQASKDATTPKP